MAIEIPSTEIPGGRGATGGDGMLTGVNMFLNSAMVRKQRILDLRVIEGRKPPARLRA
jgi:hypothetical protein